VVDRSQNLRSKYRGRQVVSINPRGFVFDGRRSIDLYDAIAEAARTGQPYQTRLDPPTVVSSVAHPDNRGEQAMSNLPGCRPRPKKVSPAVRQTTGLGPAKLSTALREIHPGEADDFKGEWCRP
jgi:hypothetical protein